jgi:rRNA maturation RNase YbeY
MIFEIHGKTFDIKKNRLERVAEAAFSVLGEKDGEISLRFVTGKEMAEYNFRYRNKRGATDVLSFVLGEDPLIAQILICYTKAETQAADYRSTLAEEIDRLLIHGICHVFGYDHETAGEERKMQEVEIKIRERIK